MIQRRGNTDLETNLNHLTRQKLHATHNKCCGPPALRVGVKLSRELHSWKCQWKPIFRASQPGENPLRISIDICTLKEPLRFQTLSRLGISLANPDVFPVVASEKRDEAGGHSCRALPTVTGRKR